MFYFWLPRHCLESDLIYVDKGAVVKLILSYCLMGFNHHEMVDCLSLIIIIVSYYLREEEEE